MPRRRDIHYHGKTPKYKGHSITWHRYKELEYFCADYNRYRQNYVDCYASANPIADGMPRGNVTGNPTESNGIKAAYWMSLVEAIEQSAMEASPDIYQDMLFALSHHGVGYNYLKTKRDMAHGKDYYYRKRDDFFCILDIFLKTRIHGT